ncbi:MlaD family protein [Flavobacterium cellulosilyticum]|uniref:MCE family protein n=1 Tax=Flavobacterium cellulosilyticum TaxID=2541731 RepID=A0A4R5CEF2_9FLAO|nr:MlaD family protein [Flavobacterium cellulosilyticum]TDD98438.1 MCE family protein [Flavobacterium cellulosilyticum]
MNKDTGSNWKLGMFVIVGLILFVFVIYFIGKQQNLFGSTFNLKTQFKTVSGLSVGNNVRFSGINIGTVDAIEQKTDSSVIVVIKIEKDVQKFIKADAIATIGSDGLMGDKVMTISPGTSSNQIVKDNDFINSKSAVEMEDLMKSLKVTIDNAGIITSQLAQFTSSMNNNNGTLSKLMNDEQLANSLKNTLANLEITTNQFSKFTTSMNSGKGMLSKLVSDERLGKKLDSTMTNLQSGTKGLSENMEAAKENFLLRGYFNRKKKAEAKKQEEIQKAQEITPEK